jgi:hypothetical protein
MADNGVAVQAEASVAAAAAAVIDLSGQLVSLEQEAFAEQWHSQLAGVLAKQLPLLRAWAAEQQVGISSLRGQAAPCQQLCMSTCCGPAPGATSTAATTAAKHSSKAIVHVMPPAGSWMLAAFLNA